MFSPVVEQTARAHALATWPEESCGIVAGGVFVPVPNEAEDKLNCFRLPSSVWTEHQLEAVIHSHIAQRHPQWPSAADMRGQMDSALPWGIVSTDGETATTPLWFGDFVLDEPLIGRVFQPGIRDCYSLYRAAFWQQRGIKLLDFPRDDLWWTKGSDLFRTGFAEAGFAEVLLAGRQPIEVARPGDMVLMAIRSDVPNHCGQVIEGGLVLHHLSHRLSRREPFGPWQAHTTHVLRYRD
jgi:cell wall-associated NlpC family hydrolase